VGERRGWARVRLSGFDEMQDRVRFLEGQLQAGRDASSELRRIIAALTSRIPELEPVERAQEVPGSFLRAAEGQGKGSPFDTFVLGMLRIEWRNEKFSPLGVEGERYDTCIKGIIAHKKGRGF
jgi:hypothetical protein